MFRCLKGDLFFIDTAVSFLSLKCQSSFARSIIPEREDQAKGWRRLTFQAGSFLCPKVHGLRFKMEAVFAVYSGARGAKTNVVARGGDVFIFMPFSCEVSS